MQAKGLQVMPKKASITGEKLRIGDRANIGSWLLARHMRILSLARPYHFTCILPQNIEHGT